MPRLLLAFLAMSAALIAQTNSATLRGAVRDPTQASIPGATVRVTNPSTGQTTPATTNESGLFEFPFLAPGPYTLTVEREGFQTYNQTGIVLGAGEVKRQDATLTIGATNESVTVQADVSALQSETAQLSASISPERIAALPLLGRNFTSLITIQPGVTAVAPGNGLSFSMNGGPSGHGFNISLDGTDASAISTQRVATARNGFQQTNTTSLEAVQEIRVYTNNYSAEIGRATSGALNVVTKSGSNDFHFGLFEFFRNNVLNANGTVANSAGLKRAPVRLNQFGANAGGPIVRNRTFFWTGWENSNQRRGRTSTYNVLTDAGRAAIQDSSIRSYVDDWIPRPNQAATTNPLSALLIRNEIVAVRESIGTARVDHRFSDRNQIFFRYNILDAVSMIPGLFAPRGVAESNSRQTLYTLSDSHTFSPAVVNELRLGANRFVTPQVGGGPVPTLTVVGGILSGVGTTENYLNTAYNAIDTLFIQRGRHGIKMGFEYREIFAGRKAEGNANFVFNSLNDLFTNTPSQLSIVQRYGGTTGTGGSWGGFLQDDWKPTSTLTLNLGVRYDYFFVPGEKTGRAYNVVSGIPPIANLRFNQTGEALIARDLNNFAPRFGFAWAFRNKMVLRGGYGLFFSPQQASFGVTASANSAPPVVPESQFDAAYIQPAVSYTRSDAALKFPFTTYGAKFVPPAISVLDPKYRENYAQQWNLTVEREVTPGSVVSVGYVASKNSKVEGSRVLNLPRPLFNNTREDPRFTNITYFGPLSSSTFHSMQIVFTRRLAGGLTIDANYVWAHSIDNYAPYFGLNGSAAPIQNQNNINAERGESEFDVRHQFKTSFLYQLPFHSQNVVANQLVRNWEVSGIVIARTGTPFSILTGRSIGDSLNNQRANYVTGQDPFADVPRALNARVLNSSAFVIPTAVDPATGFIAGNLSKSALTGPPSVNWNLAVHRNFSLLERGLLQFRAEMFNAFNQVNYSNPVNSMANPNFGRIIGAGAPREIQLAVKLNF
ncbi:MAG: TonB-dependent receptor [Bryobacteraceae bacterium]|nr:TonB-dependent receptor [Bryobacteraceae bacterium]